MLWLLNNATSSITVQTTTLPSGFSEQVYNYNYPSGISFRDFPIPLSPYAWGANTENIYLEAVLTLSSYSYTTILGTPIADAVTEFIFDIASSAGSFTGGTSWQQGSVRVYFSRHGSWGVAMHTKDAIVDLNKITNIKAIRTNGLWRFYINNKRVSTYATYENYGYDLQAPLGNEVCQNYIGYSQAGLATSITALYGLSAYTSKTPTPFVFSIDTIP